MIHKSLKGDSGSEPGILWYYFIYLWPLVIHVPRLCGVLWLYTFDTPQFYMKKNGMSAESFETTAAVLRIFYHKKDVPRIHCYLMKEFLLTNETKQVTFLGLFKKDFRKRLLAGIIVNIGQQISGIDFFN
jgi:hypothetical protein